MTARQQPTGDNRMSKKPTEHNLSLFAQPLNGSKFPTPIAAGKQEGAFWSRPFAWTMAVIACGALLSLSRPDKAQNSPAARTTTTPAAVSQNRASNAASSTSAANSTPTIDDMGDARNESRRSIDFYTQAVRGNMFTAPIPPTPPAPKPVVIAAPVQPVQPIVKVPPVVINPFAEWSYTGVIKSDDQITALVENTRTKDGMFLKAGDMFMGSQIATITDQEIALKSGKTSYTIAKSDNTNVTPLDRSAIPTNGQGQAQPGQQPNAAQLIQQAMQMQMQNMQGGGRNRGNFGGGGGGQTFTLPNGRQLNQQQFQRRSQGLNQNFNQ